MSIKIGGDAPPWPDYKDLLSDEDWKKYFEGTQYKYDDPLTLALIRCTTKLAESLSRLYGANK